jgi:hypothetical protein
MQLGTVSISDAAKSVFFYFAYNVYAEHLLVVMRVFLCVKSMPQNGLPTSRTICMHRHVQSAEHCGQQTCLLPKTSRYTDFKN